MEKHVTVVGALHIVLGTLGVVLAAIVFLVIVGGGLISGNEQAITITTVIGSVIASFLVLVSLPGIIGGYGLLKGKPWARPLVLILGVLDLIDVPIGTVVGVYTIWVLMQGETARVFAPQPGY
jgi:hypothetical protein